MLIGLAIGDAYGAGFEFVDQQTIELYNNLNGYIKHPRHDIGPGCYTDDTQMSLAVAEAIVSRESWTPELLATKFVAAFHRDRRLGIENATIQAAITHNIPDGIKAAIAAALM
jgi:ADP-ribosylglycohydrolase